MDGLIATIGILVGIIATYLTFVKGRDKDIRREATEKANINSNLIYIGDGITDIKKVLSKTDDKVESLSRRITRNEESVKSSHKRLDRHDELHKNKTYKENMDKKH